MKYWIVIHDFKSYHDEHDDLIGLPGKRDRKTGEHLKGENDEPLPYYDYYENLQIGDKFAYYCQAPKKVVIGLFSVIDGPAIFTTDWDNLYQFKIEPIYPVNEENYVSYYELVNTLEFFKDKQNNIMDGKSAGAKLKGALKEIEESDFAKIEELYTRTGKKEETPLEPSQEEISLHNKMIFTTHSQSSQFQTKSYIGIQERNRVIVFPENEFETDEMEKLPSWLEDVSLQVGTYKRIIYIDNIWFIEESKGFYIPFAVFEHEKDANLRSVMDRFVALNNTLNSNTRFQDIDPLYFIIAKDLTQVESYKNRITEHGEWQDFEEKHQFFIYSIDQIEKRAGDYVSALTNHLIKLFASGY